MLAPRVTSLTYKLTICFVVLFLILTVTQINRSENSVIVAVKTKAFGKSITRHKSQSSLSDPDGLLRVTNNTLGFEKIYVISLPERSDKRDALTLISSLVGFKIDWIDGVKGESVPDKAVPFGTDRETLWESNLGSWRGHMNAIRG